MNKDKEMFNGDDLAISVWKSKYALDGETHYDQMHQRMAKEFGRIELKYGAKETPHPDDIKDKLSEYGKQRPYLTTDRIYELFKDFKYIIPQGSIMSQLGAKSIGSLSNCFFIDSPEDSYGGIFQKDQELVQLMKRRGGVGMDISTLRPSNTPTSNAAKSSTGAVSFMHRFSNSTREVAQSGRRGALMISIDINHPDVLDFIKVKRDINQVTGANISIKINNDFMRAVENDEDYILRFPCDIPFNVDIKEDYYNYNDLNVFRSSENDDIFYLKKIKAKEYWNEIIKSAHNVAEPGILFWDNTLNNGLDAVYNEYKPNGVNPCGEVTLSESDSCRLMVVNIFSFVEKPFTKDAYFNFNKFYKINYEAMRLSDDLVDLELEAVNKIINKIKTDPEPDAIKKVELDLWERVKNVGQSGRRTGLGFTGLGDMLAALGVKYDSDEALLTVEKIMYVKMESELDCTIDMAITRGTFEGWDKDLERVI